MDGDTSGSFQRSTRMPLEAVVRLHFEGTVAYQNGFAANVSATGMFVKHPDPPPVGTRLVFEFTIGGKRRPVQGAGTVVWIRERYEGPGRPAGIGIQFTQIDQQSREHLTEALFEYLEASLAGGWGQAREDAAAAAEPSPSDGESAPASLGGIEEAIEPIPIATEEESLSETVRIPAHRFPGSLEAPESQATGWRLFEPATDSARMGDRSPFQASLQEPEPLDSEVEPAPLSFSSAAQETPPQSSGQADQFRSSSARNPTPVPPIPRLEALSRFPVAESLTAPGFPQRVAAVSREELQVQRSWRRAWLIAALGLVALAAGGWWWWQSRPFRPEVAAAGSPPRPPRQAPTPVPTLPAVGSPDRTLVETVATPEIPDTAPAPAPPAAAGRPAPQEVVTVDAPPPAPTALPNRPSEGPAPPVELPRARALTEVEWSESLGVTTLILALDGNLPAGAYLHSELGGEQPRWLLRLRQMGEPFGRQRLEVGTSAVRAVRFGWHGKSDGFEQHVVVDLASPRVRLEGFEVLGSRILVRFAVR